MATRTTDGRAVRLLSIMDEWTRECLSIDVARNFKAHDVVDRLTDLFTRRGAPEYIRSDNGPEFTAKAVRLWLPRVSVKTLYIEPGSPWENGYVESFQGKLRDELIDREAFDTLLETQVLVERWRHQYNTVRPHSSLWDIGRRHRKPLNPSPGASGLRPSAPREWWQDLHNEWYHSGGQVICDPSISVAPVVGRQLNDSSG
jgi:transposase InsO family protein